MQGSADQAHPTYRNAVGDGLVLRWSTVEDTERIAQLLSLVHRENATAAPNERIKDRVRLLMRGDSPLMQPQDFAVVEDTSREERPFVACACLWHHTWEFAGIPVAVGRPEYVAVAAAFRHRGLIRAIFAALHARSIALGHQMQVITGINYFYRQFGYEYALDLDGKRLVHITQIPHIDGDEVEPYVLRDAVVADIPDLLALHMQRRANSLLWSVLPAEHWRYQIVALAEMGSPEKVGGLKMITDRNGAVVGYLHVGLKRWGASLGVYDCEIRQGVNLRAVLLPILRALERYGQGVPNLENTDPLHTLTLQLGREHAVYDALGPELASTDETPYAWYVRVPDILGFLRMVTPVLEERLAASPLVGYTGELRLDWYRGGMRLGFIQGQLRALQEWQAPLYGDEANAGCPPLVFLQLLFGYRSLDELRSAFPDVWARGEARLLLNILFPKRLSYVLS